jgi:hypothetical protein
MIERWYKTQDGKEVVRVRDAGPGVDGRPRWHLRYSNGDTAYLWPESARILLKGAIPCDPVPGMLA